MRIKPSRAAFSRAVGGALVASVAAYDAGDVASLAAAARSSCDLAWYARRLDDPGHAIGSGARRRMPAASLIKLLIAYALANDVANGVLSWDTRLMVTSRDAVDGSPAFGPRAGSGATVDALAFAMLAQSDNTASNVLLGRLGFARANEAARKLGLAQTSVERRFYDWAAQRRGRENRTSPRDVGELLAWFVRASETASTSAHDRALRDGAERVLRALYAQEDRETIPGALPDRRIANKTGELTGYRHDAAIVGAGRARYVLVAMTHYRGERAEAVARIRGLARTVDAREREIVSSGLRVNRAALG